MKNNHQQLDLAKVYLSAILWLIGLYLQPSNSEPRVKNQIAKETILNLKTSTENGFALSKKTLEKSVRKEDASTQRVHPKKEAKRNTKSSSGMLIHSKQMIHRKAVNFANWVDNFFGSKDELESASYDYLRLVNNVIMRQGQNVRYTPRIRAKVLLPQLSDRTSLLFSSNKTNPNEDFDTEENEKDRLTQDLSEQFSAAFNYQTAPYGQSVFDFRLGMDSSFNTFALVRQSIPLVERDTFSIHNYNYLFWEADDGFGAAVKLQLDKVLDEATLFRWRYSIRRAEKSLGNEWKNRFSLVNRLPSSGWIAYEFRFNGNSEQSYKVESYDFSVRLRKKTAIDWLFFEIEPRLQYLRRLGSIERELVAGIIFRLEVQFEE